MISGYVTYISEIVLKLQRWESKSDCLFAYHLKYLTKFPLSWLFLVEKVILYLWNQQFTKGPNWLLQCSSFCSCMGVISYLKWFSQFKYEFFHTFYIQLYFPNWFGGLKIRTFHSTGKNSLHKKKEFFFAPRVFES